MNEQQWRNSGAEGIEAMDRFSESDDRIVGDRFVSDESFDAAIPPIGPFRVRSANCLEGDHEYCAAMVEQDAPELGITDCLCDCHEWFGTTDGVSA